MHIHGSSTPPHLNNVTSGSKKQRCWWLKCRIRGFKPAVHKPMGDATMATSTSIIQSMVRPELARGSISFPPLHLYSTICTVRAGWSHKGWLLGHWSMWLQGMLSFYFSCLLYVFWVIMCVFHNKMEHGFGFQYDLAPPHFEKVMTAAWMVFPHCGRYF